MKMLGKILLWILLLITFALIAALFTTIYDLAFWIGVVIFVGLIIIYIIAKFIIKRLVFRYRTGFVRSKPTSEQEIKSRGLKVSLERAIKYVEENQLAGGKKEFIQNPWTLTLGMDSSGVSTLLDQEARLSFNDAVKREDAQHARNKTWLLDGGVYLEPDSQLLVPSANAKVEALWQEFIHYIQKFKKKQPIDQVLVILPADLLLEGSQADVKNYGQQIRSRIDQLSRMLGYKMNISVVVSKLDQFPGFEHFIQMTPVSWHSQAFGYINDNNLSDNDFISKALSELSERCEHIINALLLRQSNADIKALNLPNKLRATTEDLKLFTESLLERTGLGESPELLSCHFTGLVESKQEHDVLAFSHDLFETILPRLIHPLPYIRSKQDQLKRNSWIKTSVAYSIVGVLVLYMLWGYVQTDYELNRLVNQLPRDIDYSQKMTQNLLEVNRYDHLIDQLKAFKQRWTVQILPYQGGLNRLSQYYGTQFSDQFRQHVLRHMDQKIQKWLQKGQLGPADHGEVVENIVSRIKIINAKLNDQSPEYIRQLMPPEFTNIQKQEFPNHLLRQFGKVYQDYVIWNRDPAKLRQEKGRLIQWLSTFDLLEGNWRWLVPWANNKDGIRPLTYADLWHGEHITSYKIAGGYRHTGQKTINQFISNIEKILPPDWDVSDQKQAFLAWYQGQRLKKWERFAANFHKGRSTLNFKYQWDNTYDAMLTKRGPYMRLLDELHTEFRHFPPKEAPVWIKQLQRFYNLLTLQYEDGTITEVKDIGDTAVAFLEAIEKKPSDIFSEKQLKNVTRKQVNNNLDAANILVRYKNNLKKLFSTNYTSGGQAFHQLQRVYSEIQSGKSKTKVSTAFSQLDKLKQAMSQSEGESMSGDTFWNLLRGPLDYYIIYLNQYTSCYLQNKWNSQILSKINNMKGDSLPQVLFGQNGIAWKFLKNYSNSFVKLSGHTYIPVYAYNHKLPFKDDFFQFINTGKRLDIAKQRVSKWKSALSKAGKQTITIQTKPTNLNNKAKFLPYKTELKIKCKNDRKTLYNYNYPQSLSFHWKMGQCGHTRLKIHFEPVTLIYDYEGDTGFLEFLKDFEDGYRQFKPKDFPDEKSFLEKNNIHDIRIQYQIQGVDQLMNDIENLVKAQHNLDKARSKYNQDIDVPQEITHCWD